MMWQDFYKDGKAFTFEMNDMLCGRWVDRVNGEDDGFKDREEALNGVCGDITATVLTFFVAYEVMIAEFTHALIGCGLIGINRCFLCCMSRYQCNQRLSIYLVNHH